MASSFAEDFLRGVMMARAQKEQKRRGDLEQQQFMLQSDRQRAQDKRQGILDQQGEAARVFEFLKQQAMPREELPAGQAGPAAPAPRPTIKLPLLSGGVQEIQPQYAEDVATQQRAAQDVARTSKLEDYAQQAKLQREAAMRVLPAETVAKLFPGQDPSQPVDMNVAQLASTIRAGDESRAAAAGARAATAEQTKAIRDAAESGKQFTRAGQLADNYRSETAYKNYATVAPQYEIVKSAATDPSGASDLSLIFSYMKILDPGSTVREGEFANAQNSGGIPDKIKARYNQIISGERLSQAQRNDFALQAGRVFKNYESVKRVIDRTYEERAKRSGLNPEDVIVTFPTSEQAGGGSAPLMIGGYRVEEVK